MQQTTVGNKTFRILSCISIVLILLGHLNLNILEFGGLFPYYSYHVMIFIFIAGYFYKDSDEKNIGGFILRKCKKLMLPYMVINLIYGVITTILAKYGYSFGQGISLRSIFLEPFIGGHHFMLIAPGWFIPALFMLEICNVVGRKVLSLIKVDNEYIIMALYLLVGLTAVALAKHGSVYDYYKIPARLMFMAPVLQLGRLYRTKLEEKDTLNTFAYLAIVVAINVVLYYTQAGLAFSAVWVSGFKNAIFVPYLSTITGIALWLRISKLLSKLWKEQLIFKAIDFIGANTFIICMLHLSAFFIVNVILSKLNLKGFDINTMHLDVYYAYGELKGLYKLIYLVAGMTLPLIIKLIYMKIFNLIKRS